MCIRAARLCSSPYRTEIEGIQIESPTIICQAGTSACERAARWRERLYRAPRITEEEHAEANEKKRLYEEGRRRRGARKEGEKVCASAAAGGCRRWKKKKKKKKTVKSPRAPTVSRLGEWYFYRRRWGKERVNNPSPRRSAIDGRGKRDLLISAIITVRVRRRSARLYRHFTVMRARI